VSETLITCRTRKTEFPLKQSLLKTLLDKLQRVQNNATGFTAGKPVRVIVPSIQFTDWLQVAIADASDFAWAWMF
jgi:hypothetical protein